jgi:hypothetical protein
MATGLAFAWLSLLQEAQSLYLAIAHCIMAKRKQTRANYMDCYQALCKVLLQRIPEPTIVSMDPRGES